METQQLFHKVTEWVTTNPDVQAACVVGSHARGEARQDSDIDLVLLSFNPQKLLDDLSWRTQFGEIDRSGLEDWGALKSARTFYRDGTEIEFGVASLEWAQIPVDPGTLEVVANGMKILYDPEGILKRLQEVVVEQ
jgi:uncharacterized protein